jgi:hypothetical protein
MAPPGVPAACLRRYDIGYLYWLRIGTGANIQNRSSTTLALHYQSLDPFFLHIR